MDYADRPGITSRLHPGPGRKRVWEPRPGVRIPLPIVVDHVCVDPNTRETIWVVEATVALVQDEPALTRMTVSMRSGIDPHRMQREFRWASPLEIVRDGVPSLIERGIDPFTYDLPLTGFPESAGLDRPVNDPLTDAFLEEIAREYLALGRGYAKAIAAERHVSPRTVVSWVEKARRRGILTRVRPGSIGGALVPRNRRQPEP